MVTVFRKRKVGSLWFQVGVFFFLCSGPQRGLPVEDSAVSVVEIYGKANFEVYPAYRCKELGIGPYKSYFCWGTDNLEMDPIDVSAVSVADMLWNVLKNVSPVVYDLWGRLQMVPQQFNCFRELRNGKWSLLTSQVRRVMEWSL
jgi:hypothetical protein